MSALALVLSNLKVELPNGGSVSLVMAPIFVLAFTRGAKAAALSGVIVGVVKAMLSPHIYHPIQFLLDYPVAYGSAALGALFPKKVDLGVIVGMFARFAAHFTSGIVFFASFAPRGMSVWRYSLVYNAAYIVPETVITVIIIRILAARGVIARAEDGVN